MKIIRWITFVPIGIISFLLSLQIVPYILGFIWKVLYFIMFWGSKYDIKPTFDFEYAVQDFKVFISTSCLGTIISGGISGIIAGFVAPKSTHTSLATILYSIPTVIFLLLIGYVSWNSEHWFYCICIDLSLIIAGVIGIAFMSGINRNEQSILG